MIAIQRYEDLGRHTISWLDARYHFSFMYYRNPKRMRFGKLRVINDDIVKAKSGFDTHPHQDMEIITYVRKGAISHEDSEGNKGRTSAGDVQVMSAGSGIEHAEFNKETVDTNLYQIWIEPHTKGVKPRWDAREFPKELCKDGLKLLVSGRPEDEGTGALYIHQYAAVYGGRLAKGATVTQSIKDQAYLLVSEGAISVNDQILKRGDGAEITGVSELVLTAKEDSEVLVIDVPV